MRLTFLFLLFSLNSFSQSVGIGTTSPNSSAALDIVNDHKGLLIPRVVLLNIGDKATIPNPSSTLLVWNNTVDLNAFPNGPGFYYNNGTPVNPIWRSITGTKELKRFEYTVQNDGPSITLPLLNKKIIEVSREGLAAPKVLLNGAPYNNNVVYDKGTGKFTWNFDLFKTEEVYILYYD